MASTINASTSSGLISSADTSGVLQLQTANITAITIDATQKVGIGTTSPAFNLDVTGSVRLGSLTLLGNFTAGGTISETVSSVAYVVASQYDIGSGANDIPLNQYLGKLAFKDVVGLNGTANTAPTIASATTIQPLAPIVFVSGTTTISTITVPIDFVGGGQITLIPTGVWATNTSGNIALASTAVANRALIMTYDAGTTKWYPSY